MPLGRKPRPFDHPECIFELKYDGFHALAVIEHGNCTLFSRNGNPFALFADLALRIGNALMPRGAVLDGEIVCLDRSGRCSCDSGLDTVRGQCAAIPNVKRKNSPRREIASESE
jgi:ATP-dependent DNA ligase